MRQGLFVSNFQEVPSISRQGSFTVEQIEFCGKSTYISIENGNNKVQHNAIIYKYIFILYKPMLL